MERPAGGAVKALRFERKPLRFAAANVASRWAPGRGATYGPLELTDIDPPTLPGRDWVRLRPRLAGICGSDLATIDGTASRYFEPIVSFPFVPGHEVVADTDDDRRVVVEPVLGCVTRGIEPPCGPCARGDLGNCERLAFGRLEPGLQSGFCADTGGGWSTFMVSHESQLHPIADAMSDEAAVMVEPTACAVHAALAAGVDAGDVVVVSGAGTLGLLCVAALRHLTAAGTIVCAAKHPEQRRWAAALGADAACAPDALGRLVRRLTGSMAYGDQLTGGADAVLDCVGSEASIAECLAVVAPRRRVTVVGMPATVKLNLTTLWHRETQLAGAYAYGTETLPSGERRRTFDLALELVKAARLERLVSASYPLADYRAAIEHAAEAGRRGAVKVVFDLTHERERYR
jgi:threonine dehydrogenase-like Zn-dependent dehydrogenase